jgi:hypothetical protein
MEYSQFCQKKETDADAPSEKDLFMKEFLRTVGTTSITTELQPYYKESDMFWCHVEIKDGWMVRLRSIV